MKRMGKISRKEQEYKQNLNENLTNNPGQTNESINEYNSRSTKIIKETTEHITVPLEKRPDKLSIDTTTGKEKEIDQRGDEEYHGIHRK